MQDVFIEYLVKKQKTPATLLLKILVVLAAAVISFAAIMFGGALGAFSIVAPLLAVGACYGAYYLITSMNIEYEYSVTNGELDIDQITAQRKRKRLVTVNCRDVEAFGKYKAAEHQGKNYQTKVLACDYPDNPDLWYAAIRLKQSGLTLVVFNANQKMLDGMKPFLPRPIMHEAFRVGN